MFSNALKNEVRAWLGAGWRTRMQRWLLVLCVLGLGACSGSLPRLVPDLAAHSAPLSPQLLGSHGFLSPAQSRAMLARLAQKAPDSSAFQRHLALEEAIVGSPLTVGNRVRLLRDGPATYRAMLAAIEGARDHIHMETYIFDDDEVGQRFAAALIAKQRAGVQVNLVRDSVGTLFTPTALFEQMQDSGVRVLQFNPVNPLALRKGWSVNQRDHRKLLIVDGKTAFLGGINISGVYSSGSSASQPKPKKDAAGAAALGWRDTDIEVQGPAVAELQKLFLAVWAEQKADPLEVRNWFPPPEAPGRDVVRAIGSSPSDPFSFIYATLLSAIGNAGSRIQITNAYFAPDPQLLAALEGAAARGVDVRLILPSETDSWLVFHAGRAYYGRLLRAGVKIYERRGRVLHSKTALIDGVWATVGSTNLDWRSFLHNHELNAVVLGSEFGAQVQAMFEDDLAESDPVLLEHWKRRPLDLRIKEGFARLWEYWL